MMYVAVLFCLAGSALAAPADTDVVPLEKQQPTVIPIVSQSEELEPNGTYKFSYETGNGIKREETSYDKVVPKVRGRTADSNEGGESGDDSDSDEIHVQQGSYSYTAPDGTVISVRYIADENGFQPIGDHIPRVPAPPSGISAEKSGRALKTEDSAAASSAPAASAKPADKPKDKPEAKASASKIDLRSGTDEPASTPSSDTNASTKASSESSTTETANASEGSVSTEGSSTDASTTESVKASETPAPTEASTTEAAKSSEVTEASSTPASESSTTEVSTTAASTTSAA